MKQGEQMKRIAARLRKLNPRQKCWVRHNKHALAPADRERKRTEVKQMQSQLEQLRAQRKALGASWPELLRMARFVLDVDGQASALDQLRPQVELLETKLQLDDEIEQLHKRSRAQGYLLFTQRWEACVAHGMFCHVVAQADTLGELEQKVGNQYPRDLVSRQRMNP